MCAHDIADLIVKQFVIVLFEFIQLLTDFIKALEFRFLDVDGSQRLTEILT